MNNEDIDFHIAIEHRLTRTESLQETQAELLTGVLDKLSKLSTNLQSIKVTVWCVMALILARELGILTDLSPLLPRLVNTALAAF